MEKDILIPIFITSLIWLIIVLIVYFQTKSRTEKIFENANKKLEGINSDFNKKLEKLLAEKNSELKASYEKGYSDSEN
ncbi:MAG: hypothetical protein OEW87_14710 [Flavobacteriaceae bacterium]|nr:hypothetical protein [Flavobacteriaceae bacterium]